MTNRYKPTTTVAVILVAAFGICFLLRRLYFHPLAHIPGPRLAALTRLFGFYHNAFRNGSYCKRFPGLHAEYDSPVVRIGSSHVHVNDPRFYEVIFNSRSSFLKEPRFYGALDAKGAFMSIVDPQEFRAYRQHYGSLFSTRAVTAMYPVISANIYKCSNLLLHGLACGRVVDLQMLYRNMVADIVCEAMLGRSVDFIQCGDASHPFLAAFDEVHSTTWTVITFPSVARLLNLLPESWQARIAPEFAWFRGICKEWLREAERRKAESCSPDKPAYFDLYVNMDKCDPRIRSFANPIKDSFQFLLAGVDTTTYVLSNASFHILNSPTVLTTLRAELEGAMPFIRDDLQPAKLQALPYLTAVIKETLRMAPATPGCLPRVVPSGGVFVGKTFLPAGTTVSVTHPTIQMNAELFPEPNAFRPDRWLDCPGDLEHWNVGFSRGSRRCIGMNLAYAQLYATIAYVFSRFELVLFDTDESDMVWSDYYTARTKSHVKIAVVADRWFQA